MKMKLDKPSSLATNELPAVGRISPAAQPALATFDGEQYPGTLGDEPDSEGASK